MCTPLCWWKYVLCTYKSIYWSQAQVCTFIMNPDLVHTKYVLIAYTMQKSHVSLLSFPSALGSLRPMKAQSRTSFRASEFWPQRGSEHKAGAAQSSTAMCWSCKYGCPSARKGLHHQHSSIWKRLSVLIWNSWSMEWWELARGGPQPFQRREWEETATWDGCYGIRTQQEDVASLPVLTRWEIAASGP